MLVSFLLRLSEQHLAAGEVNGHVEVVDTGERIGVTSVEDLLDVLCRNGSPLRLRVVED